MADMLNLQAPTPERWLRQVENGLDELLVDHAHCEKKAAGVAMNLLFIHVEDVELCREMMDIVREELDHFRQVLDLLARRGIRFRRIRPGRYGERLHGLLRRDEPQRSVDRLLVAALIEARSCERFGLLRDHLRIESWPTSSAACSSRRRATTAPTSASPGTSRPRRRCVNGCMSWPRRKPASSPRATTSPACTVRLAATRSLRSGALPTDALRSEDSASRLTEATSCAR